MSRALNTAKKRLHEWWWARSNAARVWLTKLPARIWPPAYRPMLDFMLDLGFLRVRTELMRRSDYNMIYEYVGVELMLLRWGFRCRLYDTMQRRLDR